jgi:hypothetical protein
MPIFPLYVLLFIEPNPDPPTPASYRGASAGEREVRLRRGGPRCVLIIGVMRIVASISEHW